MSPTKQTFEVGKNLILFGPPGIGKSTILGILKSQGVRAIDLEDVYPSRVRFTLPNQLERVVLGAADLNPARKYPGCIKILLYANQNVYDARRAARDAKHAEKGQQAQHKIATWRQAKYDYSINTSYQSPSQTASLLKQIYKEEVK